MNLHGSDASSLNTPIILEARKEFESMSSTCYQHRTQVNRVKGIYRYDCVGFVSYALRQATPQAWKTVFKLTGIARGRIPSPRSYRKFFAELQEKKLTGWEPITKGSSLLPGDIVAWELTNAKSVGHAVVIGTSPVALPNNQFLAEVYDSTSSPHGDDSRPNDMRAEILFSTGRRSGLGHGMMVFSCDPHTGSINGLRWSPSAKLKLVPISAGRPTY